MTTMTVQIPTGQVGWFEQMLHSGDKDLTDLHQFGHCQILTLATFKRMYL